MEDILQLLEDAPLASEDWSSDSEDSCRTGASANKDDAIVIPPARAKRLLRQRTQPLPIAIGDVVSVERHPMSLQHTVLLPVQIVDITEEAARRNAASDCTLMKPMTVLASALCVCATCLARHNQEGDMVQLYAGDFVHWNGFRCLAMEYGWESPLPHDCRAVRAARRARHRQCEEQEERIESTHVRKRQRVQAAVSVV